MPGSPFPTTFAKVAFARRPSARSVRQPEAVLTQRRR